MGAKNDPRRGVFWVIERELFAFPFEAGKYPEALAKSKETYTHQKLWPAVRPKGCGKPYHYYPRGRVHITKSGAVHLYLSPHITDDCVTEIKARFGITGEAAIHREYSAHYRCHFDAGWRAER